MKSMWIAGLSANSATTANPARRSASVTAIAAKGTSSISRIAKIASRTVAAPPATACPIAIHSGP